MHHNPELCHTLKLFFFLVLDSRHEYHKRTAASKLCENSLNSVSVSPSSMSGWVQLSRTLTIAWVAQALLMTWRQTQQVIRQIRENDWCFRFIQTESRLHKSHKIKASLSASLVRLQFYDRLQIKLEIWNLYNLHKQWDPPPPPLPLCVKPVMRSQLCALCHRFPFTTTELQQY